MLLQDSPAKAPSVGTGEPYIHLYPTKKPKAITSLRLRMMARHEEHINATNPGAVLRQQIFRVSEDWVSWIEHLYTDEERHSVTKGYLHFEAPALPGAAALVLPRNEYQNLCGALSAFCLEGKANPDRVIFRPSTQSKPMHSFLSYYDRNAVMTTTAFERTVADIEELRKSGKEVELIRFMSSRYPKQNLPKTWLLLKNLIQDAHSADGSIASIRV